MVDGPAGQPEEDGLGDILSVSHAARHAVSGFEDTGLVCPKDFLKLCRCFCNHDHFYRGRQVSSSALLQPKTR